MTRVASGVETQLREYLTAQRDERGVVVLPVKEAQASAPFRPPLVEAPPTLDVRVVRHHVVRAAGGVIRHGGGRRDLAWVNGWGDHAIQHVSVSR